MFIYFCYISRNVYSQKQSPGTLSRKDRSAKCCKIHKKTLMDSLFKKSCKRVAFTLKRVSRAGIFS